MSKGDAQIIAKILVYAALMSVGITFLAVLFIRDWRKYRRK